MTAQPTATYKFLYKFLLVLDASQVHKLHKIVSGLLDVSVFSSDEIARLEKRLSLAGLQR
ncbi:MAG: hypothetical protein ABIU63_09590 [Chitinophagaceae bacterium]